MDKLMARMAQLKNLKSHATASAPPASSNKSTNQRNEYRFYF